MVVALMKSDKWDNLVVQYVSLLGFGVFCYGIGLLS